MYRCTLPVAVGLAAAAAACATTYIVDPYGTGDFPNIQAAVDACVDGDVIELTDGTFMGDGNRDIDYLGKALTIQSQNGHPETCVIDCEGTGTDPRCGFSFQSGETAESVLMGITIRGGWADYPEIGSAIYCGNTCSPSIASCILTLNAGSAVGCDPGCAPRLEDCLLTGNEGRSGAAICADRCDFTLSRCEFIENASTNVGGAIYAYDVRADLIGCTFVRNTASSAAGAIFRDQSEVNVRDCLFEGNASSGYGAALTFWISGPNMVERCTFTGNSAGHDGAALWSEKISSTHVIDCTFWGNACPDGTLLAGNYEVIIENTVVAFSTEGAGVVSHYDYADLVCCDIFGNAGGDWVGTIADQYGINGNICEDPLFCDPENGDFTLDQCSPCAPFTPPNPECALIGAWPVGCGGGSPAIASSWGEVKVLFRD